MYARALAAFLLSLFAAFPCVAYAQDSVFIDDLTSPELQALIRDGRTIALVPIGGTEQNGPHMVLGKHNVRVKALAEKIARALGNALVAPVIAYVPEGGVNPPTSHMRFAGTLTIPAATFESVLEYAARTRRGSIASASDVSATPACVPISASVKPRDFSACRYCVSVTR